MATKVVLSVPGHIFTSPKRPTKLPPIPALKDFADSNVKIDIPSVQKPVPNPVHEQVRRRRVPATPITLDENLPPIVLPPIPQPVVQQPAILEPPIRQPSENTKAELTLRPWQIEWAERAQQILLRSHGYIDTSKTGLGKTYIALWLARTFNLRLLVICPPIMMAIWRTITANYGVSLIDTISYASVASIVDHEPKHGLLTRTDTRTDADHIVTSFTPTETYMNLISQGVLVIMDEFHKIKNLTAQYKACLALLRPILVGGSSRYGLLSGTPFDKPEHAINILRLIGYIRSHRLYRIDNRNGEIILEGLQELLDVCNHYNREETTRVLAAHPPYPKRMKETVHELYKRVIKASSSGAMLAPSDNPVIHDIRNGFYNIHSERLHELIAAINALGQSVRYNSRTGEADLSQNNLGSVTKQLRRIENAKANDMARVATEILSLNTVNKVILAVNYTNTIEMLGASLQRFRPLILNGETPLPERERIRLAFMNDPRGRLLIMNAAVGGLGISLHDMVGNAPRFMFISPSYRMIDIIQCTGRIFRDGVRSDATVRLFYGKGTEAQEERILAAMARKSGVLRSALESTSDVVLPDAYPVYTEAD